MLAGPVTVFAGLGTPAAVLVESTRRIREAVPDGVRIFQVDPLDRASSVFAIELGIEEPSYIQLGWVAFMRKLSERLVSEHRNQIETAVDGMIDAHGVSPEDVSGVLEQLTDRGLLGTGRLRARWILEPSSYVPHRSVDPVHIANLLLAVAFVERETGSKAKFDEDGLVHFYKDHSLVGTIRIAAGRALLSWLALETRLRHLDQSLARRASYAAVVCGVTPLPTDISTPTDIAAGEEDDSIVGAVQTPRILTVEQLRADAGYVLELLQ